MPTLRMLKSVAHDIAHHAASGMSWLHPHACQAARAEGIGELHFDLLSTSPLGLASIRQPLHGAAEALHLNVVEMLGRHGFGTSVLRRADLAMSFPISDEHYCLTTCRLETVSGKVFQKTSSSLG